MSVERVFRMKEGVGETSYAKNSLAQKEALHMVKHITIHTIIDLYVSKTPQTLHIADLGCSSGSNALSVIGEIVKVLGEKCCEISKPMPEFQVFLNDLPTNDFNSLFVALPDFYNKLVKEGSSEGSPSVFVAGVPGSFYGRLFPSNSLDFIHSSFSLHWLSQVPPGLFDKDGKSINKGKMYISKTSPKSVTEAYFMQFQEDFTHFLKLRSKELISGGRMVLMMQGRKGRDQTDRNNILYWELLAEAFASIVSLGEVEQELVDSYDIHFYSPSLEEVEGIVQSEGSFEIDHLEGIEIGRNSSKAIKTGRATAMTIRAIQEPLIRHKFGDGIIDPLFERYGELLEEELAKEEVKSLCLIVVLRKLT
ncbi:putative methyltransferase TCM_000336 [Tasmannia lanceolata]|uniref:putative methyltransferase TCM_000336 n=1 Tax=Tasmannia lanceolata TaxID=3420 RepID=UPI004062C9DF